MNGGNLPEQSVHREHVNHHHACCCCCCNAKIHMRGEDRYGRPLRRHPARKPKAKK